MENLSLGICAVCNMSMTDPRLLPCAHSFCLKCLESLIASKSPSRCPTCQIQFQIPEGGLKDLRKNEFIEQLNSLKHSNVNENEAIKVYIDRSSFCCGKIPSTSNHQPDAKEVVHLNSYSICNEHIEMVTLFCKDCKFAVCSRCFVLKHINHKVEHIQDYFDSVLDNMKKSLKIKEGIIEDIASSFKNCGDIVRSTDRKACEMKKEILKRRNNAKRNVDSFADKLTNNIDKELDQEHKRVAIVMEELKTKEADLNAYIETLKKAINNLNFKNVTENFLIQNDITDIPKVSGEFNVSLYCDANEQKMNMEKWVGTLRKAPNIKLIKEMKFDFVVKCLAVNQENLFLCSTKGGVHFVNQNNLSTFKSHHNLCDDLLEVTDTFAVNNILYFLVKISNCLKIVNVDITTNNKPQVFFTYVYQGINFKIVSCINGKLIISLSNRLLYLSQNGKLMKMVWFSFHSHDLLEIDEHHYVVCIGDKVCIINDFGETIFTYSPIDKFQTIKAPRRLAKDNKGNIYVFDGNPENRKIFVLDHKLNFISSHDINRPVYKICYSEVKDALVILTIDNYLTIFEL